MKNYKGFFMFLLLILSICFIVFVAIMQHRFTNPEFPELSGQSETNIVEAQGKSVDDENDETNTTDSDDDASTNEEETASEVEDEDEESEEVTISIRTVDAETLNARSGPGIDYEITGILVQGQQVQVEDTGGEWVRVITDEFTGYVNARYLTEE